MRVLVTGSTGVVGRRLVPGLLAVGHDVTAVVRSPERGRDLAQLGADTVAADLFDPQAVAQLVAGHEVVINLATHIPPSSRAFLPGAFRENDRIRREVSKNLVDASLAAGVSRFIQESFAPAYRSSGHHWITEEIPLDPPAYARTVLDAERQAERFTKHGRVGVILRFALFYGPDSVHTLDTIRFVRGGVAPTAGRPEDFISSVSTDDAASAALAALHVPASIYNVGDDEPVTRAEYFASLAAELGVKQPWLPPASMAVLMGSVGATLARSHRLSNQKLKQASGWSPACPSMREGWKVVVNSLQRRPVGHPGAANRNELGRRFSDFQTELQGREVR
jgi:2-alkyl-3-oxoalkanoate reductase